MADPLGPDRYRIRREGGIVFRVPIAADRTRVFDPCRALARALAIGVLEHAGECYLGIAVDGDEQRIVAAKRLRVDVDLDRWGADLRHCPEMRGHAAGLGTDEKDEIGAVDHA